MKTRSSKTPAVQAKNKNAFFGKEGQGAFFGAQPSKEQFFGGQGSEGGDVQAKPEVQTKLTVGEPNDIYEKEADATAEKIVRRTMIQRKCDQCEKEEKVQKKPIFESEADPAEKPVRRKPAASSTPAVTPAVESGIRSSRGGGSPLPASTRRQMESGLGADLSGVRVHNDGKARQMSKDLNAQAFTHGKDIYFNSGKYDPASSGGQRLLAHELTHVVQQNGSGVKRKAVISRKEAGTASTAESGVPGALGASTSAVASGEGTVAGEGLGALAESKLQTGEVDEEQEPMIETDHNFIQRVPMVQKAGGKGGADGTTDIKKMNQAAIDTLGSPPKQGRIKKTGKKIEVHFKDLPFKQYGGSFITTDNKKNEYIANPPFLKPVIDRKTRQGYIWRKNALPLVTTTLNNIVTKRKIKGPVFRLTVKKGKNLQVEGTVDQIARQVVVPFWDKKGKGNKHQIEHKIDWQVSGGNHNVDAISNLLLLDADENQRIGLEVLKNMTSYYSKIIGFYANKKVTGLAGSFNEGKEQYLIYTDSIDPSALTVKGSMITIDNMKPGDDDNPFSEERIDLTEKKLNRGEMVLVTSAKGGGNIVRYDLSNKFIVIKGNADKHTLTSITLKDVVRDDNGILDKDNPDKKLKFKDDGKDHYKVDSDGFASILNDSVRGLKKLSPITWEEPEFDPLNGWSASGKVKSDAPLLEKVDISIIIENSVFTVEATVTTDALDGKLPKPFNIDYSSLTLSASSDGAFAIGGEIGFSIEKYGSGSIGGSVRGGGKAEDDGFGLAGKFEFEKESFSGFLSVEYEKKGNAENWKVDGEVKLNSGIIPKVNSLTVNFSYDQGTLSGSGKAELSIPQLKEIEICACVDHKGTLVINGKFELGKLPKVKGGTGSITVTKSGNDWDLDIKGKVVPDLDIKGLTVNEVDINYHRGVFDISTSGHYERGKIKGDFTVGLTNMPVSEEGKLKDGPAAGDDLKFYADGQINVDIVEGVGGQVGIKITPAGDILLNGKIELTEDKHLLDMPPLNENLITLNENIPLASCVVVTLSLHFGGAVDIYAHLNPLSFDKGSYLALSNVSLKDFSKAEIDSHLSVSSHLDAGIKLALELGLDASLLGILHAGVKGKGTLDFRALDAGVHAIFNAGWSADQGIRLKDGKIVISLDSKLIAKLEAVIEVYADLLVTDISIWSHSWKLKEKEWDIKLFGDDDLTIPLPIGQNGQIAMSPHDMRGQLSTVEKAAANPKEIADRSENFMDGKGTTDTDRQAQVNSVVKKEVLARFRDPERFVFNKSVDYLRTRYELVDYLREKALTEKHVDLSFIEEEIKKCEFEEYEKFGEYLEKEKGFDAQTKYDLIDDFITNHPSLGETERINLRSLVVVPDKKKKKKGSVKRKEIDSSPVIQLKQEEAAEPMETVNEVPEKEQAQPAQPDEPEQPKGSTEAKEQAKEPKGAKAPEQSQTAVQSNTTDQSKTADQSNTADQQKTSGQPKVMMPAEKQTLIVAAAPVAPLKLDDVLSQIKSPEEREGLQQIKLLIDEKCKSIGQKSTEQKMEVSKQAADQRLRIGAELETFIGQQRLAFEQTRIAIDTEIETKKALIGDILDKQKKNLSEVFHAGFDKMQTDSTVIGARVLQAARDKGSQANVLMDTEKDRAQKEVFRQAAEARQKGKQKSDNIKDQDPQKVKVQQNAVLELAERQAVEIANTLPEITGFIEQSAGKLADGFMEHAIDISNKIGDSVQEAGQAVSGTIESANQKLDAAAAQTIDVLVNTGKEIIGQVNELEMHFVDIANQMPAEAIAQIDATEKAVLDQLDVVAGDTVTSLNEWTVGHILARGNMASAKAGMELIAINGAKAMDAFSTKHAQLDSAIVGQFDSKLTAMDAQLTVALAHAKDQTGVLGDTLSAKTAATVAGIIETLLQTFSTGNAELIAKFTKTGNDGVQQFDSSFDSGKAAMLKGENDSLQKNEQTLTQLDAGLDNAAQKAASDYAMPAWQHILISFAKTALNLIIAIALVYLVAIAVYVIGLLLVGAGFLAAITFAEALVVAIVLVALVFICIEYKTRLDAYIAEHGGFDSGLQAFGIGAAIMMISILSLTGIPAIIEGLMGHRFFSDKEIPEQERYDLVVGGIVQLLLMFTGIRAAKAAREGEAPGGIARFFDGINRTIEVKLKQWIGDLGKPSNPTDIPLGRREPTPNEFPVEDMPADLKAIRETFKDDEAIDEFDFEYEKRGPKEMQRLVNSIQEGLKKSTKGGTLEGEFIKRYQRRFGLPVGDALPEVGPLKSKAEALLDQINTYAKENPNVKIGDIIPRLEDQIHNLDKMQRGQLEATTTEVQSARSNIGGIQEEFNEALRSKDLVAVGKEKKLKNGKTQDIDIEFDNGRQYTEVKNEEPFTLESSTWDAVKAQTQRYLDAAANNPTADGTIPKVNVFFPKGATPEVVAELRNMGVNVKGDIIIPPFICDPGGNFCVPANQ